MSPLERSAGRLPADPPRRWATSSRAPRSYWSQFIAFLEDRGERVITIENTLAWVTLPGGSDSWRAHRLSAVRGFAAYLHALDAAHEVPPAELCPNRPARATPYLYSDAGDRRADGGDRDPPRPAAPSDLSDADRAAGGHRHARRRGDPAGPRGRRSRAWRADGPRHQVRQDRASCPLHPSTVESAARLRPRARPALPRADDPGGAGLPSAEPGCSTARCTRRSSSCATTPASGRARRPAAPGSTTSGTGSLCRRCSTGIASGADVQPLTAAALHVSRAHPARRDSYWYLTAAPELLALAADRLERDAEGRQLMSALAPTLQAWFTDRLIAQRNVSPHTIRAYRDTLRLLLDYAQASARTPAMPARHRRARRAADRRVPRPPRDRARQQRPHPQPRLAAIHSLFRYAQHRHPEHAQDIARVLAIPLKRADRAIVTLPRRERDRGATRRPRPHAPGPADATTRCSCWPSRPGCASPS